MDWYYPAQLATLRNRANLTPAEKRVNQDAMRRKGHFILSIIPST